mgnify:CR=1 FL=1
MPLSDEGEQNLHALRTASFNGAVLLLRHLVMQEWGDPEEAPPPAEDPTWPKGCIVGCTSREAMKELNGGAATARACE